MFAPIPDRSSTARSVLSYPTNRRTWTIKGCYDNSDFKWESELFWNVYAITKWHVELLIKRKIWTVEKSEEFEIQLFLCHHDYEEDMIIASYSFLLEGLKCDKIKMSEKKIIFTGNKHMSSKPIAYGSVPFSFTLSVEIDEIVFRNLKKDKDSSLYSDVYRMWEENKFCDFVISVEGKDISVHRLILAGASPVFEAMLEHDMLEKSNARMVIEDYKVEVIKQLLHFVYTRKDPDFKSFSFEDCLDLLRAANQYGLKALMSIISRYLISKLSIENVADILLVADEQSVANLKENAVDFICRKGIKLSEKQCLNKLKGKTELWEEIALRKLQS